MKVVYETMSSQKFLFMKYLLYLLENKINNKKYVGQTMRSLDVRIKQHLKDAESGSNYLIHRAIRKYGIDNFNISVIKQDIEDKDIDDLEKFYIDEFNTYYENGFGYNQTLGGRGTKGYIFTEEIRSKIGRANTPDRYTLERSNKISLSLKGKPFSEEHRKHISEVAKNRIGELNSFYNKHHSDNSKLKISEANGKPVKMLGLDGNLIRTFNSVKKASTWLIQHGIVKNLSAHARILRVCHHEWDAKTAYGYKWEFVEKV